MSTTDGRRLMRFRTTPADAERLQALATSEGQTLQTFFWAAVNAELQRRGERPVGHGTHRPAKRRAGHLEQKRQ